MHPLTCCAAQIGQQEALVCSHTALHKTPLHVHLASCCVRLNYFFNNQNPFFWPNFEHMHIKKIGGSQQYIS